MPRDTDFDNLQAEAYYALSPWQRKWVARQLHDNVSGPVTTLAMQVEIVIKMHDRDMDIAEELASLKENVANTSQQIVALEKAMYPKQNTVAPEQDPEA